MTNAAVVLLGHLIVSEERIREMLNDNNRKLTEYAAQVEDLATAKERNRLAREIHDNVGHYLTAVNMQIEAARAIMETDPAKAQQTLVKAQTLTKEGLAEIRRSVSALRANPVEARPLHEAIELLVEEHRTSGLDVNYQVRGVIRPVSAAVEITLFRIAQEALTNVRKHARATHADLLLQYTDAQHVNLKIDDNGSGSTENGSGFGLLGIQERLKLFGGTLNIDNRQGHGFTLLAEIPT
jgi:signal transduction histidine kinase